MQILHGQEVAENFDECSRNVEKWEIESDWHMQNDKSFSFLEEKFKEDSKTASEKLFIGKWLPNVFAKCGGIENQNA